MSASACILDPCCDPALVTARQMLYRFASLTLIDPRVGSWRDLQALHSTNLLFDAAEIVRGEPAAAAKELRRGERSLEFLRPERVLAELPREEAAHNAHYEQTFGLVVCGDCPPYETEYVDSKFTFQRSNALADIAGFYRAFGLEQSSEHPERQDHLSLEFEFMAWLLGLKRAALGGAENKVDECVQICQNAEKRFLEEHVTWWTPTFAMLLERRCPTGFYGAVARFIAALSAAERSLFNIEHPAMALAPSAIERPEECEGCTLHSIA
jgi:TorA maturation chaperone TorD